MASGIAVLFGFVEAGSPAQGLATVLEIVWEIGILGLLLIFRGFSPGLPLACFPLRERPRFDGCRSVIRRLGDDRACGMTAGKAVIRRGPERHGLGWRCCHTAGPTPGATHDVQHCSDAGNLPAELTSFIGRRRQLQEVKSALTGARLVTLVGPGGVGKTRLALRSATDLSRGIADGAWLVELAGLRDAELVTKAVMTSLGLRDESSRWPVSRLIEYVASKRLLLVLDNCEHLLDACAVLADALLREAPGLRILATSRQPLGVAGETVIQVGPLSVPERRRSSWRRTGSPSRRRSPCSSSAHGRRARPSR